MAKRALATRPVIDSRKHTPPTQGWVFDAAVAAVYDDMLVRSIPQYDVMRAAVTDLAAHLATTGGLIVDLACSQGGAMAPLVRKLGDNNRYLGVDTSAEMLDGARTRFASQIAAGTVRIAEMDLRHEYPREEASVTLAVLALQFIPIEHRQRVVRRAFEQTRPGGALIVVEKMLGATDAIDDYMVDAYYALKAENGYTQKQIAEKRRALEGVLVPLTAQWNEDMLRTAGFSQVDCFWRWMNFGGWVAIRAA